ncbi:MAG: hypothetical protein ACK4FV_06825 [Candidatus Nitrosocaldus sp.]
MKNAINSMSVLLAVIAIIIAVSGTTNNVYAHTNVVVGDVEIIAGWLNEPPVVGERNAIYFEFIRNGRPYAIDPSNLSIEVRYGNASKSIDIEPLEGKLGVYISPIIPTRTGTYSIYIKGSVAGNPVDASVFIEDVESKGRIAFPDVEGSDSANIAPRLQVALAELQKNIDSLSAKVDELNTKVGGIEGSKSGQVDSAYNYGIVGLGLGAAGVIVGVSAMIARRRY